MIILYFRKTEHTDNILIERLLRLFSNELQLIYEVENKTKIYNKEGIDPSHQHLMIRKPYSTIVHLENDRTIASYKIQNNSELALSIRS